MHAERTHTPLRVTQAWSWPRQTFGLKLGWEEGGSCKKERWITMLRSRVEGRERKTRAWQLGSEHVAVSQVKWCGLMQNWCKRHGGASRGVTQRLQVARLTWEWRVIFKWAIENTSKHVIRRYVRRSSYSFSSWIAFSFFFFFFPSQPGMIDFQPAEHQVFFPPLFFPSLWSRICRKLREFALYSRITIAIEMDLTGSVCKLARGGVVWYWSKV